MTVSQSIELAKGIRSLNMDKAAVVELTFPGGRRMVADLFVAGQWAAAVCADPFGPAEIHLS